MFSPKFQITAKSTQCLIDIELSRLAFSNLPVSSQLLTSLRESARLTQSHYSTQIGGNRDETEVKNYFSALDYVDGLIQQQPENLTVEMVQTIHGCVMTGKPTPTEYRDGQNVIQKSGLGNIIYILPEQSDVAPLMEEMVSWINLQATAKELPAPLIAAIAHYQFATTHPYYDSNGGTAQLLTNLILHRSGYGLKAIYPLEEYYAKNFPDYYGAISVGGSHNYYMGRAEADISHWLEYFCGGMADSFSHVQSQAEKLKSTPDQTKQLRELDQRQKRLLPLFRENRFIKTNEVAQCLSVQPRTALNLCKSWVEPGFLLQEGARRGRRYELAEQWQQLL